MTLVDFPMSLSERQSAAAALQSLSGAVHSIRESLTRSFLSYLAVPEDLQALLQEIERISETVQRDPHDHVVTPSFDPATLRLLRTAVAHFRRFRAGEVERMQRHLTDAALTDALQSTVAPFDRLLEHPNLQQLEPRPCPRLADYVTAEGQEAAMGKKPLQAEERDPKHRILLSASLLAPDVEAYRAECEDRRRPFAVAFVDLDDFKAFNAELGEVAVDRHVLPDILGAVEAAAYGHGRAYRHGGDEFVILLPNADESVTVSLLRHLKTSVEALRFQGTDRHAALSAGVWITVPDSHLTGLELIEKAAQAKQSSKNAGKGRITLRVEYASRYAESVHE